MVFRRATVVDSTHLELTEPLSAEEGRVVLISVADSGETDEERQEWLRAAEASLEAAYSESEPDYPESLIREPNSDYVG